MIDTSNIATNADNDLAEVDVIYSTTAQEYVEIIRDLTIDDKVARVKDIAEERGVTRSSVSTALGTLTELGLVDHEHYGYVTLTDEGNTLGEVLTRRHSVIERFLSEFVGLSSESADREACILEHAMSPETLIGLIKFIRSLEK